MNKRNNPPAGVLGIGIEAFLPPGSYVPDRSRPGRAPSFVEKSLAVAAKWYAGVAGAVQASQPGLLLSSLRQRGDWSGRWYKRSATGLKYLARAACMPLRHGRFLSFVDEYASMRVYRQRDPRLLERHMHRFVNAHWHRRQRLDYLNQHYRFALTHLPSGLFDLVYALGHASLGSLTAKDGSLLTLCMRPPIFKGCEGELCLQLCDGNEDPLYSIVFTVSDRDASIMIGCLQGPRGKNAKEVVRELTRMMHGMRPKQLMLSLVYAFARYYGITRLLAISNDAHPLRHTGRPLHSDYDAFWQEQHGTLAEDGWYALPPAQNHKSEAEVASHHRSAFRRREALRRQAEQLLINALEQPVLRLPEHRPQALRATAGRPSPEYRAEASWVS
ncbi:VirK/YbjX family protein [Dyella caseinilytica]|uniref:DUF535 family protein n=1 Tax=Dyella caseinilytica TaxID=1849581 RepID=A0ABX7GTK9_9GAMM|nr:DUF535 family protein [Dyella caseinilytica]QRN53097.1 DUF535 family protein [Dyella caseinilytica]GGA11420.1 hypothetical protein GCM10011408_35990 [Dyella caseinilytica]